MPASHQYLLTVLSIWWAFGQLLGSLVRGSLVDKSFDTDRSHRLLGHSYPTFLARLPLLLVPSLPMKVGATSCIPWVAL